MEETGGRTGGGANATMTSAQFETAYGEYDNAISNANRALESARQRGASLAEKTAIRHEIRAYKEKQIELQNKFRDRFL